MIPGRVDSAAVTLREAVPHEPMMPIAWTKTYRGASGRTGRVFTTTMGSGPDFANEGYRRLLVNAVYWCLGMEDRTPARAAVDLIGRYEPTMFGMFDSPKASASPSDQKSESQ